MPPDCAWCGAPATRTVTLEPARMGLIKHPIHGPQKTTVKKAITVEACATCAQKSMVEAGKRAVDPRTIDAGREQQTTIYDMGA